ncbi:MAG: molybdopterin biosynthesis protein [Rhodobacteraceae bacterium]|nr:molybdopterin biosynthesis protein [Paracoccaceae bacterium]
MLLVALFAGTLWCVGLALKVPARGRWQAVGLVWLGAVAINVVLPQGHPLRLATGREPALWLLVGGFAALVMIYRSGLVWLKERAVKNEPEAPAKPGKFTETELERYARHIVLRELGGPGQRRLKAAKVLVVGAGGLGAPALQYLAAAGVGTIGVIDGDTVENANLQRQVIHTDDRIGMAKVFSAEAAMRAQNPYVDVRAYNRDLDADCAEELFAEYDVILDGVDNFDTRYLSNRTAVALGKPLVSGALSQWEGQLSVFDPGHGGPCYQCIFPQAPAPGLAPSCAEAGVLGPLPGVVGAMMAVEAVKLITDAGTPLRGQMLIYDALYGETRTITLKPRADCPVCHGKGVPGAR